MTAPTPYRRRDIRWRWAVGAALVLVHVQLFLLLMRSEDRRPGGQTKSLPVGTLRLVVPLVLLPLPARPPAPLPPARNDRHRDPPSPPLPPSLVTRPPAPSIAPGSTDRPIPGAAISVPSDVAPSQPSRSLLDSGATQRAIRDAARTGQRPWQRDRAPDNSFDLDRRLGGGG